MQRGDGVQVETGIDAGRQRPEVAVILQDVAVVVAGTRPLLRDTLKRQQASWELVWT